MGRNMCEACYWLGQCESDTECDYFTPIDSEEYEIVEYERILRENTREYEDFLEEFHH